MKRKLLQAAPRQFGPLNRLCQSYVVASLVDFLQHEDIGMLARCSQEFQTVYDSPDVRFKSVSGRTTFAAIAEHRAEAREVQAELLDGNMLDFGDFARLRSLDLRSQVKQKGLRLPASLSYLNVWAPMECPEWHLPRDLSTCKLQEPSMHVMEQLAECDKMRTLHLESTTQHFPSGVGLPPNLTSLRLAYTWPPTDLDIEYPSSLISLGLDGYIPDALPRGVVDLHVCPEKFSGVLKIPESVRKLTLDADEIGALELPRRLETLVLGSGTTLLPLEKVPSSLHTLDFCGDDILPDGEPTAIKTLHITLRPSTHQPDWSLGKKCPGVTTLHVDFSGLEDPDQDYIQYLHGALCLDNVEDLTVEGAPWDSASGALDLTLAPHLRRLNYTCGDVRFVDVSVCKELESLTINIAQVDLSQLPSSLRHLTLLDVAPGFWDDLNTLDALDHLQALEIVFEPVSSAPEWSWDFGNLRQHLSFLSLRPTHGTRSNMRFRIKDLVVSEVTLQPNSEPCYFDSIDFTCVE